MRNFVIIILWIIKIQILIKTDIKGTVSGKVVQRRSCRSITIGNCIYKSESPNLQFLCTSIQVIFLYCVLTYCYRHLQPTFPLITMQYNTVLLHCQRIRSVFSGAMTISYVGAATCHLWTSGLRYGLIRKSAVGRSMGPLQLSVGRCRYTAGLAPPAPAAN